MKMKTVEILRLLVEVEVAVAVAVLEDVNLAVFYSSHTSLTSVVEYFLCK